MSKVETGRSLVVAALLSAPCWWVDVTRQETHRCYRMTCPACDTVQHHHETRFVVCVECGHEFEIEQITRNDPNEVPLFDVPHLGT